uniref:DNMT1-RFD domain-containing protein n=1 Tax=Macrostomum lignano TaxID=282301 RepID=A0A1I8FMJ8_9PLAT
NVELYFSGLLVPVYAAVEDEEAAGSTDGGLLSDGPIDEWWLSGFDGGQRAIVGFSTVYGEYILAKPHSEYRFLMESALEKIHLTKRVTECLLDDSRKEEAVEYEELLGVAPMRFKSHASFLIEQVRAMDDEEGTELMRQPCMQTLVELGRTQRRCRQRRSRPGKCRSTDRTPGSQVSSAGAASATLGVIAG